MNPINIRYISKLLGLLIHILSGGMCFPLLWSLYEFLSSAAYSNRYLNVITAFCSTILLGALIGLILRAVGRKSESYLGHREALLLVSLTWFLGAGICALPFWFWAHMAGEADGPRWLFFEFINCFFEAMSALTTTGSTVLSDIQLFPRGLLFWRSFIHWLGGLGIVVIYVALLPRINTSKKQLFNAESSAISEEGTKITIKETARSIMKIYLFFTCIEISLLKLCAPNMGWFDCVCHSFATLSSGGLANYDASAGEFPFTAQCVIIIFMLVAGTNFSVLQAMVRGRWSSVRRNSELMLYLTLNLLGFGVILFSIYNTSYDSSTGQPITASAPIWIKDAMFQTTAIQSGTGFTTANFDQWGTLPKAVLLFLMLVGGCGGSTSGGIKVTRILGFLKVMMHELERAYRPSIIRTIQVGGQVLREGERLSILSYILCFIFIAALGSLSLILSEPESSGITAITASLASIGNVGPGLAGVGAAENYGWMRPASKLVLCLLMAVGRLEIFAVTVLFLPKFWRGR